MKTQDKIIKKILIANRAEIAVRIIRTCRDLGLTTVAVFSDADRNARHVQLADEAYRLGGVTATESYLNQKRILEIARQARVDAIHPGYGFLSENPAFAEVVVAEGVIFIGPSASSMRLLGDKIQARGLARQCGVPTVTGTESAFDEEKGLRFAEKIGFPVLLKAAAGGGGKGMRIVRSRDEFSSAFRTARSEAKSAFGDDRIYLEKYIERPRHIEIQILADHHGDTIYLGERECSIQRRHQKVLEETPSPFLTDDVRKQMGEAAVRVCRAAQYTNACTVEFLVDQNKNFYFLEVNTRLQVEHPVTELVTGLDLVKEQIRIAEGKKLELRQEDVKPTGHALECRVYAEDPSNNFFPSTGELTCYSIPEGPHVRVDNGFQQGDVVSVYYDPLLAKVITGGHNRLEAISSMRRALTEFRIEGVKTTIPFCQFVLKDKEFIKGNIDTHFVQKRLTAERLNKDDQLTKIAAVISAVHLSKRRKFHVNGFQPVVTRNRWKQQREENYRS